jgi:broad specificity phosphatase PhoE
MTTASAEPAGRGALERTPASDALETRWWWVRHAPVVNPENRIYGRCDLEADCGDGALYAGLAAMLPENALWLASPLRRTQQTAAAIHAADARHASARQPVIEADLVEQHFGEWQGLSWAELEARDEKRYHRFWLAPAHQEPPGGESFDALAARVATAIARLTETHAGRDIVAVAHGGPIRAALALALGIDAERALGFAIANCSLTRLDHYRDPATPGGLWRVSMVNQLPGRVRRR